MTQKGTWLKIGKAARARKCHRQALTLFDSGCSIDAMSPEFARVAGLSTFKLDNPIPLQLGCVGSRSVINFGVKTDMKFGNKTQSVYFDVVNIDHYDLIIRVPLLVQWGMTLDFGSQMIKFDDWEIASLRADGSDAKAVLTRKQGNKPAAKYS